MAFSDKMRIAANFRLFLKECVEPRILIVTDAYKLEIDNSDVKRVVQWLLPSTMPKLYQRMDRAMRCDSGQKHFTLLCPSGCVDLKSGEAEKGLLYKSEHGSLASAKRQNIRQKVKDADCRGDLSLSQGELVNALSNEICVRHVELKFLKDEVHGFSVYEKSQSCCSHCDSDFQVSTDCHSKLTKDSSKDSLRQLGILRRLKEGRKVKAHASFPDSYLAHFPCLIMPDSVMSLLTDGDEYIHDESTMRQGVRYEGNTIHKHYGEIVTILEKAHKMNNERDAVFDEGT